MSRESYLPPLENHETASLLKSIFDVVDAQVHPDRYDPEEIGSISLRPSGLTEDESQFTLEFYYVDSDGDPIASCKVSREKKKPARRGKVISLDITMSDGRKASYDRDSFSNVDIAQAKVHLLTWAIYVSPRSSPCIFSPYHPQYFQAPEAVF